MQFSLNPLARRLRAAAGALLALGLGVLGCATQEIRSELPWLPDTVTPQRVALIGVALIALAIALAIVSYSAQGVEWLSRLGAGTLLTVRTMRRDYKLLEMRVGDLPRIYPVYRKVFGPEVIPQATVEQWMRKNPRVAWKIVWVARKTDAPREELVGFFELLPLTRSGEAKLLRNKPETGSLTKNDIHSAVRWKSARAYYIASVGVMDPENLKKRKRRLAERAASEGIVTKMLFETLLKLGAPNQINVYGRPVTEDGLRVAREYAFSQVQTHLAPSEAVWLRRFDNASRIERTRA